MTTSEKKKLYMQKWRIENKEKLQAYQKEYHVGYSKKNSEILKEKKAIAYKQDGLFKFSLLKFKDIIPKWANVNYIRLFYSIAQEEKNVGNRVEIDHIVPINNPLVCGLHNEWNLQVATRSYNNKKKDRYWPDMPEYSFKDYEELYGNFN